MGRSCGEGNQALDWLQDPTCQLQLIPRVIRLVPMRNILILSVLVLGGCDVARGWLGGSEDDVVLPAAAPVEASEIEPLDPLDAGSEPVTDAALPDATLPPPVGSGSALGTTVISLGDPSIGGMWLKTPLVDTERASQVRYRGVVDALTLQPLDAEPGSGSQISVRAMQALGASLTDLVEVSVEAI